MKIIFLLFVCKLFSKDDDFGVNEKQINRSFFINNAIGALSLATLLGNHRTLSKYIRMGSRIGSLFYFYNQYKYVDKAKLNYHSLHFYFPLVLNSAGLLGEAFYNSGKKFLFSEILLSDFLLKNNTFFRIKKAIKQAEAKRQEEAEVKEKEQAEKKQNEQVNEYVDSLLSSFISLDVSIYGKIHEGFCSHDCRYSTDNILLLAFDTEHKVLISKKKCDAKFYLVTNEGSFVSYIYFDSWRYSLGNFFKIKNGKKGIGKKFFNWVIDFLEANCCNTWCDCYNLFNI